MTDADDLKPEEAPSEGRSHPAPESLPELMCASAAKDISRLYARPEELRRDVKNLLPRLDRALA